MASLNKLYLDIVEKRDTHLFRIIRNIEISFDTKLDLHNILQYLISKDDIKTLQDLYHRYFINIKHHPYNYSYLLHAFKFSKNISTIEFLLNIGNSYDLDCISEINQTSIFEYMIHHIRKNNPNFIPSKELFFERIKNISDNTYKFISYYYNFGLDIKICNSLFWYLASQKWNHDNIDAISNIFRFLILYGADPDCKNALGISLIQTIISIQINKLEKIYHPKRLLLQEKKSNLLYFLNSVSYDKQNFFYLNFYPKVIEWLSFYTKLSHLNKKFYSIYHPISKKLFEIKSKMQINILFDDIYNDLDFLKSLDSNSIFVECISLFHQTNQLGIQYIN